MCTSDDVSHGVSAPATVYVLPPCTRERSRLTPAPPREVLRVLRPGGLLYFWHHWVPGPGWPPELLAAYRADPLTGPAPRLSHEEYVQDVQVDEGVAGRAGGRA